MRLRLPRLKRIRWVKEAKGKRKRYERIYGKDEGKIRKRYGKKTMEKEKVLRK